MPGVREVVLTQPAALAQARRVGRVSFGEAQVNVLATSDNHGHIERLPGMYAGLAKNFDQVFPQRLKESTLNVMAIVGDWFIDLKQKGYRTKNAPEALGFKNVPGGELTAGYYNIYFLNKFVEGIRDKLAQKGVSDEANPFRTIYTPGNHCLEDSDYYWAEIMKNAGKNMTTIISNAELEKSPAVEGLKDVCEETILEVPDDKDKSKIHKVLVLGLTVNTVDYYLKDKITGLEILDRSAKKTEQLNFKKDIENTCEKIYRQIEKFRAANPDGAVLLMNHNGNAFSASIVEHLDRYNKANGTNAKIDVLLNGHDHKDQLVTVGENKTPVISLGQNNEKFEAVKIHFDDDGKVSVKAKKIPVDNDSLRRHNPIAKLLKTIFSKDFKRDINIVITDAERPGRVLKDKKILSGADIRFKNNELANFLTDALLEQVKSYDSSVDLFGISSSAIRGDLPVNDNMANNFEIIGILCGVTEADSKIKTGQLTGRELAEVILENVAGNMVNETRNEIIQWSGLQIDKDNIIAAIKESGLVAGGLNKMDMTKILPYVRIKTQQGGDYQSVEPEKVYKLAVPLEMVKGKLADYQERFEDLECGDKSGKALLREYFEKRGNRVEVVDPASDVRIITWKNNQTSALSSFMRVG